MWLLQEIISPLISNFEDLLILFQIAKKYFEDIKQDTVSSELHHRLREMASKI